MNLILVTIKSMCDNMRMLLLLTKRSQIYVAFLQKGKKILFSTGTRAKNYQYRTAAIYDRFSKLLVCQKLPLV